ncbi:unnamed protein product [Moneuplotes crassus]|uniref:HTH myb-type domain-containing protein n=1 Tax=Euplotes crassus TaxID=5936 RepID=A0AAD2D7Z9_EUPCR|nr:unnamed protein product [Moneuplotes crassus]
MVPTRDSLQIRSHAQKYFKRIKNDFNTNDPVDYIRKGMCDESPFYKFDKSKFNKVSNKLIEPERKLIEPERKLIEPARKLIEPARKLMEHVRKKYEPLNKPNPKKQITFNEEIPSARKHHKQESQVIYKKRLLKQKRKYVEDSSSSDFFKSKAKKSYEKAEYRQVSLTRLREHARRAHRKLKRRESHFSIVQPDSEKVYIIKKAFEINNCSTKRSMPRDLSQCTTRVHLQGEKTKLEKKSRKANDPYKMATSRKNIPNIVHGPSERITTENMITETTKEAIPHMHETKVKFPYITTSNLQLSLPLVESQTYNFNQRRFVQEIGQALPQKDHICQVRPETTPQFFTPVGQVQHSNMYMEEDFQFELLMQCIMMNYCLCLT